MIGDKILKRMDCKFLKFTKVESGLDSFGKDKGTIENLNYHFKISNFSAFLMILNPWSKN